MLFPGPHFGGWRLTANAISLGGAIACVIGAVMLWSGAPLLWAGVAYGAGCGADALDGRYARRHPAQSMPQLGAALDATCDKVGELAFLLALAASMQGRDPLLALFGAASMGLTASYLKSMSIEYRLSIKWPEVRYFGRASRSVIIASVSIVGPLLASQPRVLAALASTLLIHNAAAFVYRLVRLAWALKAAQLVRRSDRSPSPNRENARVSMSSEPLAEVQLGVA